MMSGRRLHPPGKQPPSRLLERRDVRHIRPPTPAIQPVTDLMSDTERAAISLQSLIRGRAIQTAMADGLELSLGLMTELRTTDALWADSQQDVLLREEQHRVAAEQRDKELVHESAVDGVLSELDSETLSEMLRFLTVELDRTQDEQRLQAMRMLVERQRRTREAEESGSRQAEERRRRTEDELFRQMMKVQQDSVDSYLEDIVLRAGERAADQSARQEIKEHAAAIDRVTEEIEQRNDSYEQEMLVAELIYSFLIPEVNKQEFRRSVRDRQHRYLIAAHRNVYQTFEEDIAPFPELYEQRLDATGARILPSRAAGRPSSAMEEEEEEDDGQDHLASYPDESATNDLDNPDDLDDNYFKFVTTVGYNFLGPLDDSEDDDSQQ